MEDEARNILRETLARDSTPPGNLANAIAERFKPMGGVDLELPAREEMVKVCSVFSPEECPK